MKKFLKKLTASFLSVLLIFTMLPISTYAAEATSIPQSDKLNFLYEEGFIMGEIVEYSETPDSFTVEVYYSSINLLATIKYMELSNGNISVSITEEDKVNTYLYTTAGDVYFDGTLIPYEYNNDIMPLSAYAYATYGDLDEIPGSWEDNFSSPSKLTDALILTIPIQNHTISALAKKLAAFADVPTSKYDLFITAATDILSVAAAIAIDVFGIEFSWETTTNYDEAPLEYVRKNVVTFTIEEFDLPCEGTATYYVHEVLI